MEPLNGLGRRWLCCPTATTSGKHECSGSSLELSAELSGCAITGACRHPSLSSCLGVLELEQCSCLGALLQWEEEAKGPSGFHLPQCMSL